MLEDYLQIVQPLRVHTPYDGIPPLGAHGHLTYLSLKLDGLIDASQVDDVCGLELRKDLLKEGQLIFFHTERQIREPDGLGADHTIGGLVVGYLLTMRDIAHLSLLLLCLLLLLG